MPRVVGLGGGLIIGFLAPELITLPVLAKLGLLGCGRLGGGLIIEVLAPKFGTVPVLVKPELPGCGEYRLEPLVAEFPVPVNSKLLGCCGEYGDEPLSKGLEP
jgi:hypothetical protein